MNERLKELRDILELSQEEFGKRIGSARNTIANYEIGRRTPSNAVILSICREFRVNYYWLTEGVGEMFINTPQSVIDEIAEDYDLDDDDKKILEKYLSLSPEQRQVLKNYLKNLFT